MPKGFRRWHVPPVPARVRGEPEGTPVIREAPPRVAGALWSALRSAGLWSRTPAAERSALASVETERHRVAEIVAAGLERPIEDALLALASTSGERPASAEACAVSARLLGRWAEREGYAETAVEFGFLAAELAPGDPLCALDVAHGHRRRGEWSEAEHWYLRSLALARQERHWEPYVRARLGLGRLAAHRGNLPAAEHAFGRARQRARRHRLRRLESMAVHDLATVAQDRNDAERAIRLLIEAVQVGLPDPPPHNLLMDLGTICVDRGFARAGVAILEGIGPSEVPAHEVIRQGNLAFGASRLRLPERSRKARLRVAQASDEMAGTAIALFEAARSAVLDGEWSEAEALASRTLALAERRREGRLVFDAERLLQEIAARNREIAEPATASPPWLEESLEAAQAGIPMAL